MPLRLFCEHCDKYVPSNLEWRCGYCDHENKRTRIYSFLNKCSKCKRVPKSYACPHCGVAVFLSEEKDESHPARFLCGPIEDTPLSPDEAAELLRKQKRQAYTDHKEGLQQEIDIVDLEKRLAVLKDSPAFKAEKSAREKLLERFTAHDEHTMGVRMLEREMKAEYEKEFKDEPEMLEMKLESLDAFVQGEINT